MHLGQQYILFRMNAKLGFLHSKYRHKMMHLKQKYFGNTTEDQNVTVKNTALIRRYKVKSRQYIGKPIWVNATLMSTLEDSKTPNKAIVKLIKGDINMVTIAGYHNQIFDSAHIQKLADQVQEIVTCREEDSDSNEMLMTSVLVD